MHINTYSIHLVCSAAVVGVFLIISNQMASSFTALEFMNNYPSHLLPYSPKLLICKIFDSQVQKGFLGLCNFLFKRFAAPFPAPAFSDSSLSELPLSKTEPVDVLVDVENLICMLCEEEIDDMAISMNCLGEHTLHISCVQVFGDSDNYSICFGRVVVLNDGKVDYKPSAPEDIISAFQTPTEHFKETLSLKSCHSVLLDTSARMVKFFLGKKILLVNVLHPVVKSLKNASEKSYLFRLLPDFLFEACCFDENLTPIDPQASSVTIC